jgi:RNA polymerase sigma-70 factor (ECF subfamily)
MSTPSSRDAPRHGNETSLSLLERIKGKDAQAWQRLLDLYRPLILHWCARWQVRGADADDVTQEVLQAVAQSIGTYQREQNGKTRKFRHWLAGITRNKLRDLFRRRQRQPEAQGGSAVYQWFQEVPEPELADDEADAAAIRGVYHRALDLIRTEFEERTWRMFWRVTVDGEPSGSVAIELGISPAAVRKAKSRVLHRLREEVGDLIE